MFRTKVVLLLVLVFSSFALTANDILGQNGTRAPVLVVTSFSILEDLVQEIGGDQVSISNLVGRNADAHVYQPKPSDAVAVQNAELVVANGLGFEGWIARLMQNSEYNGKSLVASDGVDVFLHGDEVDPHAWQSFKNIRVYVANIASSLREVRPEHSLEFTRREQALLQQINALELEVNSLLESVPEDRRMVVTSHDAFADLGREFGIEFIAPVGFSGDVEPTAADVAAVIDQINSLRVRALFVENISSPRLLEQISSESNAVIGGTLYSDALGDAGGPAGTYLQMMRYNIESIAAALATQ